MVIRACAPPYQQFIDGRWVAGASGTSFEVYSPYGGEVYARFSAGQPADADAAVSAAAAAFPAWAALPPEQKQRLFLSAADIVERRSEELGEILARETGSSRIFALGQQHVVAGVLRQAAGWVFGTRGEVLTTSDPSVHSVAVRKPLGVVAAFTPWNGASVLAWRSAAQVLATGNTLVLKPSELAPLSAGVALAQVAQEAGFPPGVLNVVTHAPGGAGPVADVFFERPEVRCLFFIGSVGTGRMLAERAGRALKRSVMELGGYNAMIVCADTELEFAARSALYSAFLHQGQICMSARKVLVERDLYPRFVERLVELAEALPRGDPSDPATIIGPLINDRAVEVVQDRIRDAVAKGARIVAGGGFTERVHEPTILVEVPDDAEASCEETFGPLLVVQPVDSAEKAVEIVNGSLYGLTASVLTADAHRGFQLAERINSGMVHVNGLTVEDTIEAPIGGVRDSGWGRHGVHCREDLTDLVWINVRSADSRPIFGDL